MASSGGALPRQRYFIRGKDGLSFMAGPPGPVAPEPAFPKVSCSSAIFSSDGSLLALISSEGVRVVDPQSGREILSLPLAGVVTAAFSPMATYLQTFQRPNGQDKNLMVWQLPGGAPVFQQFQKHFTKEAWPTLQFSEDEGVACKVVTNEVQFYDGHALSKGVVDRLRLEKVAAAHISPNPATLVAAYVPEIKGAPASVRIFVRERVSEAAPVARRSFYKSSTVRFIWNRGSTGVLVLAHSDVDKTNKSYYGETTLHFLSSDGSIEGAVPLSKEGPIHDVQWSNSGNEFMVVHGYMPAKATLFNSRCKPLFDFAEGPKNVVRWSPLDQFIMLGGFGNLPGDMEFWDRKELKSLGKTKAQCTVTAEWSPDGRHLMTATTMPRLQVDNCVKVFKYDGTLIYEQAYPALFQAEWQPAKKGAYPELPVSPKAVKAASKGGKPAGGFTSASGATSGATSAASSGSVKPVAYRPPHSSASSAAALRAQLFGEDDTKGGSELSKNAQRNKKRREKKQAGGGGEAPSTSGADEVVDKLASLPLPSNTGDGSLPEGEGGEIGKKIRALNKKVRQIEELKKKAQDSGGVDALPPSQREKLKQEPALRQEIKDLEAQL